LILKSKGYERNIGFQDEMRAGLIPCTRRSWSKVGTRTINYQQNKYEWLYVYNVVFPFTGKCFTMFMPTVNKFCINLFWREFVKEYNEGEYLIVWDGAGFHQESDIEYDFLHFLKLPPYSPELNPAETLWKKYREFIANKHFESLDDMELELTKAFKYLEQNPLEVKSQTLFHWLKEIAEN